MFHHDPSLELVPARREDLVAVIESLNQPQVSIPGKPAQGVHGFLCGLRNAGGSFSVYVALFLPKSRQNVVYVHEPREFALEGYRVVEREGLHFLESMGFMLDNLNFRNQPPEGQERIFQRIPVFSRPAAQAPPAEEPADARPSATARLLASF